MFATDSETHVGYLQFRDHVNNSRLNNYQSVMAFDPHKGKELPPFRILDLDDTGVTMQSILKDYNSAVQNLRLISSAAMKHPILKTTVTQNRGQSLIYSVCVQGQR